MCRREVAKQAEVIALARVRYVFPSSRKMANRAEKMGSFEFMDDEKKSKRRQIAKNKSEHTGKYSRFSKSGD